MQPSCISWTALAGCLGIESQQPGAAPQIYAVSLRKNLRLGDGLFIVGAHKRFVSAEVTSIAYSVSAIVSGITAVPAGRGTLSIAVCVRPSPPAGPSE
jgi:hypothetical protein